MPPRKRKPPNALAKRCRICLMDQGTMLEMCDKLVESKLKDLTRCTFIDIKHGENLPNLVCHVCFYKLSMWTELKELFMHSHNTLEQLDISEELSNAASNSPNNRHSSKNLKRKCSSESGEDSISEIEKKKSKLDPSKVTSVNTDQIILDTIYISDSQYNDSNVESPLPKDSPEKAHDICDSNEPTKNVGRSNGECIENQFTPKRRSLLAARRGRLNANKRRASTKRWVERKMALYAAAKKNNSDSDSTVSNDTALTPRKQAQTNVKLASREEQKQKRLERMLKNLESNLAEKYIGARTDSEARKTRLQQQAKEEKHKKDDVQIKSPRSLAVKNSTLVESDVTVSDERKSISQAIDEPTIPQTLKIKLTIGKSTFVVTTSLILQDAALFNNNGLNNTMKSPESLSLIGEDSQNKNTDIIDAVRLCKVTSPVMLNMNNNVIERCLDIRIESRELPMLKRVQTELSDFILKEVKPRLNAKNALLAEQTNGIDNANSSPLNHKLKNLILNAIRKNADLVETNEEDGAWDWRQVCKRVSPELAQTLISLEYQPKVMMNRLNIAQVSKRYNINNIHALKRTPERESVESITTKRPSIPPKRYTDYFLVSSDSDSDDSVETVIRERPVSIKPKPRIYGNAAIKQMQAANNLIAAASEPVKNGPIVTADRDNGATVASSSVRQRSPNKNKGAAKAQDAMLNSYICGLCGLTSNDRKYVEEHVLSYHLPKVPVASSASKNITTSLQPINATPLPQREDASTSPQREDAPTPPQREDALTPPQREDAPTSPQLKNATTPLQRKNATTPLQREDATTPPQLKNATTPLQRKNATTPLQREDATTPPQLKNATTPPQRKNATTPPQREDAITPPQLKNAITPSQRKNVTTPPQRKNATTPSQREDATTLPKPHQKKKKMRCKKCHEIVEYQHVKAHALTCKMRNDIYRCHVCNSRFHNIEILFKHLQTHKSLQSKPTKTYEKTKSDVNVQQAHLAAPTMPQTTKITETTVQNTSIDKNDTSPNKVAVTNAKSDVAINGVNMSKKMYSCFLCDKTFTDEEVLKDHLQKHCDDLSDGESSIDKDQHQCAICGDMLESDQALEEHICKHWFDGDGNTSIIEDQDDESAKSIENEVHCCDQCSEMFDSETLLEAHVETHRQAVSKANQESQIVIYQYQCMLCDDLFDTEEELTRHMYLHNDGAQACLLCDKPFLTLEELQKHVMVTH